MRIQLQLDDLPEFESFASAHLAVRGILWSILNTPLGEPLSGETRTRIVDAIRELESALETPLIKERPWQEARRRERMEFAWPEELTRDLSSHHGPS